MASRQELLDSIRPDMNLSKGFFLKVYGYEITRSGFADVALGMLEAAGCSKAREYYGRVVTEYETEHEKEMRRVAQWYRKQIRREKVGDWEKRQQEVEQRKLSREEVAKEFLKW